MAAPAAKIRLAHLEAIKSVAFSPSGRYALSGLDDDTMTIWEVASGKKIRNFEGHSGFVEEVAFSPYSLVFNIG